MMGVHAGFALFGLLFLAAPVIVVGLVIVIWAVTRPTMHTAPPPAYGAPPRETPLDILQRRFASGEISAEDYQKARDLLKGDSSTGR